MGKKNLFPEKCQKIGEESRIKRPIKLAQRDNEREGTPPKDSSPEYSLWCLLGKDVTLRKGHSGQGGGKIMALGSP